MLFMPCRASVMQIDHGGPQRNPKEILTPVVLEYLLYIRSTPHPGMPITKQGLGWDSLLKMEESGNGDCYWMGG